MPHIDSPPTPEQPLNRCTGWGTLRLFACQDQDSENEGCNIHCQPCWPNIEVGDAYSASAFSEVGKHWMRANPHRPSRNARGLIAPLLSNVMFPMALRRATFQGAACATDDGRECFGWIHCDCKDAPINIADPEKCPPFTFTPIGLIWNDCLAYFNGWRFTSPAIDWMHCRLAAPSMNDYGPFAVSVTMSGADLYQMQRLDRGGSCSGNMFVPCLAISPSTECDSDSSGAPYNDQAQGATRDVGRDMFINDASLVSALPNDGGPVSDNELAVTNIKNKAWSWLNARIHEFGGGVINFDRLVHRSFDSPNGTLGHYERWWNHPDDPEFGELTEPDLAFQFMEPMTNCRLRTSGCPVTARLVIWRISFKLNLVLMHDRSNGLPDDDDEQRSWSRLSARIHVDIDLRVIAELQGECHALRPWLEEDDPLRSVPLGIDTFGGSTNLGQDPYIPRVTAPADSGLPSPPDHIIYVDNDDQEFEFPWHIKWKGYRGEVSNPQWEQVLTAGKFFTDIKYPDCGAQTGWQCCGLANELSPFSVGPHPTGERLDDPDDIADPNGYYLGGAQFELHDIGNVCACAGLGN